MTPPRDNRRVWSSDGGRVEEPAEKPSRAHTSGSVHPPAPADGVVRVSRETKGRKGKGVTLITGVPLAGDELRDLAGQLKQRCGSGGTVKDGVIEIQGDHRDALVPDLSARGWAVKKVGG